MLKKSALIIIFSVFLAPNFASAQTKLPPAAESGLALKMLKKSQPGRWEPPPQPQPEVLIIREDEPPSKPLSQPEINKTIELKISSPDKNTSETPPKKNLKK